MFLLLYPSGLFTTPGKIFIDAYDSRPETTLVQGDIRTVDIPSVQRRINSGI